MPKYLLLKHYRGGPEQYRPFPPMDQWAPEDVEAHMTFLRHVGKLLEENGEYVDGQALTPAQTWVRYGGPGAAPVTTEGPLPETSDLVAGWYMVDVESYERAVELAAYISSEPGPGGGPLYEWIERPRGHERSEVGRLIGVIDESTGLDEGALRALVPRVLAGLVRRGEDFDAAEDALQEALVEALRVWPEHPPRDPRGWLATVATRRLVDARRSESARQRREDAIQAEPRPAATEAGDDTLFLLFCCCHPDLTPASQLALTLRAVAGLSTREIADACYVPEATMAQRISRAKRTIQGRRLDQPGDLAVVLRVLYLIYTVGHGGRLDLAGEAIRLARQLTLATEEPEARGLLALMLLNHARLPARLDEQRRIVTLDWQDRGLWDTREIAEGVGVLQSALAVQRPGRYQIEAAIAALHDDAASAEETDWPQILAWYDDLVALTDDPVHQDPAAMLARAVAVGHVRGATAGLAETDRLREVLGDRHRWHAVRGHLHELSGELPAAAKAYADAARLATDIAERDHLIRQAARIRAAVRAIRRRVGPPAGCAGQCPGVECVEFTRPEVR